MTYKMDPKLVNGRFGDPVLFVDLVFGKRALLFDIGDIRSLSRAQLRLVTDVFVSHTHMDHFSDFDNLLRVLLRGDKQVRVFGPAGMIDKVRHKLSGYSWNLACKGDKGVSFTVMEVLDEDKARRQSFHFGERFRGGALEAVSLPGGVILDDHDLTVTAAVLDHKLPCLAYAVQTKYSLNVWKSKLAEMGLPVGVWINRLKDAIRAGRPGDARIRVPLADNGNKKYAYRTLGELKAAVVKKTPGEKITYVVDVLYSDENNQKIIRLAQGADILFIEAGFRLVDKQLASERYHLTTKQAGQLAAKAGVRQVEPFHFSLRYEGEGEAIKEEVQASFKKNLSG